MNDSCSADSASPSVPGSNRAMASISISAGSSPPLEHQIAHRHDLVDAALDETLIHAFVPPGHQHQRRGSRGQLGDLRLRRPARRPPRGRRASRRARAARQARSPAATARPSSPSRGRRRRAGRPPSDARSVANCRGSIVSTVNTSRATARPSTPNAQSLGRRARETASRRRSHHVRSRCSVVPMPVERHPTRVEIHLDDAVPHQRHQPLALTAEHHHRVRRQLEDLRHPSRGRLPRG